MTLQQIYTAISRHLLEQNERSEDEEGNCLYRGPNGLKCPVGALIKDEVYNPDIEAATVRYPYVREALWASGVPTDDLTLELLGRVQRVHDTRRPEDWPVALQRVAAQHDLEPVIA